MPVVFDGFAFGSIGFGAGFGADNVTCQIEGLGRIADIQKMYVDHAGAVIK